MSPILNRRTYTPGLLRKTCATAVYLLLGAAVLDCGSASDAYVPLRPAQAIPIDEATYAFIGREALERHGYHKIIEFGVEAGFLRYREQTNTQNFVGQTLADAASQAWPVFTKGAVAAGIVALFDSPAPGPADVAAIGMLVVALVNAGYVGVKVWTSWSTTATATPIPTATPTTTTTAPPIATPTTTTTAPPIALPRKYPNQTCDNARLKTLSKLKDLACNTQKRTCGDDTEKIGRPDEKHLTCAEILLRLSVATGCVAARKQIQTECYAGSPDPTHEDEIKKAIDVLAECMRKVAIRGPGGGPCTN